MTYRQLTDDELRTYSYELSRWREWVAWRDWARGYYGPTVARLEILTEFEYDDEGGYYDAIRRHHAYDAEGNELEHDFSAPAGSTSTTANSGESHTFPPTRGAMRSWSGAASGSSR